MLRFLGVRLSFIGKSERKCSVNTLVAIRWEDQGMAELRECWEVNSLKDGKMQWKALCAKEDGTTFEQTVDWERVEE